MKWKTLACIFSLLVCSGISVASAKAPYGGSATIYNNPDVDRQLKAAWRADENGTMRDGTWEYGFRIDCVDGQIIVGTLVMGDEPYRTLIPCDENTIAIAHVHPNNGVSTPSKIDMDGKYPDYVISRDGLCVTDPKTHTYRKIKTFSEMFKPAHPPTKHKA